MEQGSSRISDYLSNKMRCLSFVYAMLVVLLHANSLIIYAMAPAGGLVNSAVYYFQKLVAQDLVRCAVPSFFAISGFLFFLKVQSIRNVFENMRKRVRTLLIPFVIFNLLYCLFHLLTDVLIQGEDWKLVLGVQSGWIVAAVRILLMFKFNGAGWYLFVLIGFVCLSPLLYYTLKNKALSLLTLGLCFLLGLTEALPVMRGRQYTLFFFYLGAFLAVHGIHLINKPMEKKRAWIPLVLFAASQGIVACFGFYDEIEKQYPIRFVFEILITVSMWLLADLIKIPEPKWYYAYSFPIYCTHVMVRDAVIQILQALGLIRPGNAFLCLAAFIILAAAGIVISLILFCLLKKKANPVYRLLTGGR